ncbi:hypothetical protein ACCO45_007467 [Purpureocillium lilacinum]|uniref:Uncharacterized protein n=1 Tax=Purpureocillium lilacinum TaxID=33203 RepID=A0ACC4DSF3_PURLI
MADSTNMVAGPHRPKGETDPNTRVVPGQLLPTKPNLDQILEKFLSVYDSASILKNNTLPWYALHRDYYKLDSSRAPAGPIPGNDFHATDPRITADASAWAAKLRFAPCHRSILAGTEALCPLTVSFKHINDCPEWDDSSRELAEAAALIRHLWPKEEIGEPVGRPPSQPINRGVAVYTFTRGLEEKFLAARKQGAYLQGGAPRRETDKEVAPPAQLSEIRLHGEPFSTAQYWSFATLGGALMPFATIATVLSLLSNPGKDDESGENFDGFADRDITWALDSLQGFCRGLTPHQYQFKRKFSFTVGTSSDYWMYLHFISHFYRVTENAEDDSDQVGLSGMEVSRGRFTVPIELRGRKSSITFREHRKWTGMRVATSYNGNTPNAAPSAVAVYVSDWGHTQINVTEQTWKERGLQSPRQGAGIALFQMLLMSHLDAWERDWTMTVDHIGDIFKVKLSCQTDIDQLDELISHNCAQTAVTCSRLILVFMGFINHINMTADSLKDMRDEWARTYPGTGTERLERFDVETQEVLLENWDRVLSDLGAKKGRLVAGIRQSIDDLKLIREGLSPSSGPNV